MFLRLTTEHEHEHEQYNAGISVFDNDTTKTHFQNNFEFLEEVFAKSIIFWNNYSE